MTLLYIKVFTLAYLTFTCVDLGLGQGHTFSRHVLKINMIKYTRLLFLPLFFSTFVTTQHMNTVLD